MPTKEKPSDVYVLFGGEYHRLGRIEVNDLEAAKDMRFKLVFVTNNWRKMHGYRARRHFRKGWIMR